jgi:hypothetical protein
MGLQIATLEELTFAEAGLLEPTLIFAFDPIKFLIPYPAFLQKILQVEKL